MAQPQVEESAAAEVDGQSIGVVTAFMVDLFGTFLVQSAFLLMKVSHQNSDKTQQSALCSCTYFAGMVCLLIGNLIHVVVLPFCPIVLLSINSSTAIVMTAMLALIFLKEKLVMPYDLLAFLFISIGCTGIVLMSRTKEDAMTTAQV